MKYFFVFHCKYGNFLAHLSGRFDRVTIERKLMKSWTKVRLLYIEDM